MKKFKVGLQLFSIRNEMAKDMDKALGEVKKMGYDYVEFAGYFDHSADEVKAILDKYDLKCISVHQTYDLFLEKSQEAVDFLKTIGAKYCAIPWMGVENHKGSDHYEKNIDDIKSVAKLLADNGITMLYHNHDFEFNKYEDKFLLDWLYESIPADLLQTEIDTCWVKYAGYSPCEYLKKYSGRAPVVHLKDFVCESFAGGPVYDLIAKDGSNTEVKKPSREDNKFEFRPVGYGLQKFEEILEAAEAAGSDYVIVEQDQPTTADEMASAKMSREYLKKLGL